MRPVMPEVVGGWLDVLLMVVEVEEEVRLCGVDSVDTGVDSAVVDEVDDCANEVDAVVDVLDMELDEDTELDEDMEVDIVEMRGVGDCTVGVEDVDDPVVLLGDVVTPMLVGGTELDPVVVDGVGDGVVDDVDGGIVDGGTPQMQMPHCALVVGTVEPVGVVMIGVVELSESRWGVLEVGVEPMVELLVGDPLEVVPDDVSDGDADVDESVVVDAEVCEEDEVGVEDEISGSGVGVEDENGVEDEVEIVVLESK